MKGKDHCVHVCPLLPIRRLIVCLALILFPSACGEKAGKSQEIKRPIIAGVTVAVVGTSQVDDVYEASGTVKALQTSTVSSRIVGMVTALYVREGDRVKAGQVLLTLDDRDMAQKEKAAAMGMETARQGKLLAEATWRRYKSLHAEKALSDQEMDQVETQRKVAESEYERARAMHEETLTYKGFTRILAPASGVVTDKRIDVGSMASPGVPLLTVEGDGGFQVEVSLDEGLSGLIRTGMPAEVVIDALGTRTQGIIRDVVPAVDPRSRTFLVKIAVKALPLRSGLFVKARISIGKKDVLLVPAEAIVEKGQLTGLYTVDEKGVVAYRLVRIGKTYAGGKEVLAGLFAGERIIAGGVKNAVDGGVISGEKTR